MRKTIIGTINTVQSNHANNITHNNHNCEKCKISVCPKAVEKIIKLERENLELKNQLNKLT